MAAAIGYGCRRLELERLGLCYLDLLRVTAQQAGFMAARLSVKRS